MTFSGLVHTWMTLALITALGAQDCLAKPKATPPRVFFHTRGKNQGRAFLDTWQEGDTTFFHDSISGPSFSLAFNTVTETSTHPPALPAEWEGVQKYRQGSWWFLRFEMGNLPTNQISALYRYDPASKSWSLAQPLKVRASNFELLGRDRVLLFGLFEPVKKRYFLEGVVSGASGMPDLLEEAPIKKWYPELFWKTCVTSVDDRRAYVYFPYSGHIYAYDLESLSQKEFRVPWPLLSDESIGREIEAAEKAKKTDCFISAAEHPGASHCYFLPMPGGQMGFIYKALNVEEEKAFAFSDGSRPLIEKVGALMLIPEDPNLLSELTPPSQRSLERWCWSTVSNRLVPLEQLKRPPEKKPASRKDPKAP